MVYFPDISPPVFPIKETIKDTAFKGELENQVIIARKRFTKTPKRFEISWSALSDEDYNELRAFYMRCNCAIPFLWEYPSGTGGDHDGMTFKVRFDGDFEFVSNDHGRWQGNLVLVEV